MEIKSFDTILNDMCDNFDELITPKTIARSNTNIIYLIFKAIAKGYEVINNVCVVLNNKFNPAKCSSEDLVSVASLVGTERRKGSASGLRITVRNTDDSLACTLTAGLYYYSLDDDTKFEFEVVEDTDVPPLETVRFIAMSENIGSYPVTAQTDIKIDTNQDIPSKLKFDCGDNQALLGIEPESILDFRKRVLNAYDRQNTFVELEEYLRNLPYIFDCKVKYNQSLAPITVGGVTIPPMTCAIFYSGEVKNEIASMIADYIICPTISTANSVAVRYENEVFAGGYYEANIIPFAKKEYTVDVIYEINEEYTNKNTALAEAETVLLSAFNAETHKDFIKEDDIYNVLESLNIPSFEVLAVNLKDNGSAVDYITVPVSMIPQLTAVHFFEG